MSCRTRHSRLAITSPVILCIFQNTFYLIFCLYLSLYLASSLCFALFFTFFYFFHPSFKVPDIVLVTVFMNVHLNQVLLGEFPCCMNLCCLTLGFFKWKTYCKECEIPSWNYVAAHAFLVMTSVINIIFL